MRATWSFYGRISLSNQRPSPLCITVTAANICTIYMRTEVLSSLLRRAATLFTNYYVWGTVNYLLYFAYYFRERIR